MAWFTRFSRFGDMHLVFGQEQDMTCGPASALMCYTKINKLSPTANFETTTQRFKDLYARWSGAPYDGSVSGTFPDGLAYALNRMSCGRWVTSTYSNPAEATDRILSLVTGASGFGPTIDVNPIIVGVNWDGSTGSHWVCIDTIRSFFGSSYATICDPWDAGLHVQSITASTPFTYEAEGTIQFNAWGSHFTYSQPSVGRLRVWPIIHRV